MRVHTIRLLLIGVAFSTLSLQSPAAPAAAEKKAAKPANQLTQKETTAGWQLLFDGETTKGWHSFKKQSFPDQGWAVQDGWLVCLGKGGAKGGGDILSEREFNDFELTWDWKLVPKGNNGIKYFVLETRNEALGHEYQMLDDVYGREEQKLDGKHLTASFYAVLAPSGVKLKPSGQINHSRLLVKGNHVEHWLNGVKVLEYECGSDQVKAGVAASKFKKVEGFGNKTRGHIMLTDHNSQTWFRNLKVREL